MHECIREQRSPYVSWKLASSSRTACSGTDLITLAPYTMFQGWACFDSRSRLWLDGCRCCIFPTLCPPQLMWDTSTWQPSRWNRLSLLNNWHNMPMSASLLPSVILFDHLSKSGPELSSRWRIHRTWSGGRENAMVRLDSFHPNTLPNWILLNARSSWLIRYKLVMVNQWSSCCGIRSVSFRCHENENYKPHIIKSRSWSK